MIFLKNRKARYRFSVSIVLVLCPALLPAAAANGEAKKQSSVFAGIVGGAVAGAVDVAVAQPFEYAKIKFQHQESQPNTRANGLSTNLRQLSIDPRVWYRGSAVKFMSMSASTMFQTAVDEALQGVLPGDEATVKLERTTVAGVMSAPLVTVTDLAIQQMHTPTIGGIKPVRGTLEQVIANSGYRALQRGLVPKAGREGIFTAGYLGGPALLNDKLKTAIPNDYARKAAVSIAIGTIVSLVTQPLDTVGAEMQMDYTRAKAKTTWQMTRHLYQNGGYARFFSGATPRTASIIISILVLSEVTERIKKEVTRVMGR